jgi:hypothetical protein
MKVPATLVSSDVSLFGLQMVSSLCMSYVLPSVCWSYLSSIKTPITVDKTHSKELILTYLFIAYLQMQTHSEVTGANISVYGRGWGCTIQLIQAS